MSFPNQLSDPKPLRLVLTGAGARVTLLLVMCLAPRIWRAYQLESICDDGAFHIAKAQQIEQHAIRVARDGYDFNTYPLILGAWHRAGLDWETAAKIWGVLAGSLAVLPLFGWVRRMFDDRVAFLASALYAVQPKLVEWSPEATRDPTFWLIFTLALYCTWRAITEVRPWWFVAAGCATFAAVNTRFEGWLLLLPVLGWCVWRLFSLRQARWRLVGGVGLFALCYPLVLAALVYLCGYERWEWGSFHRIDMVVNWMRAHNGALFTQAPAIGDAAARGEAPPPEIAPVAAATPFATAQGTIDLASDDTLAADEPAISPRISALHPVLRTALVVVDKVGRAFTAMFGVLVLIGLTRWWRLLFRADHLPLVLFSLATLGAVLVHAALAWMSSTRYILPLVIITTPLAALGLLPACRCAARLAAGLSHGAAAARYTAATTVLILALGLACGEAVTCGRPGRSPKADLGAWLREALGPRAAVTGSYNWALTSYYAQSDFHPFPQFSADLNQAWFGRMLQESPPDAVVFCQRAVPAGLVRTLSQQAAEAGLEPVSAERLPASCRKQVTVLVRRSTEHVARRAD